SYRYNHVAAIAPSTIYVDVIVPGAGIFYLTQFSTSNPSTLVNSLSLLVTRMQSRLLEWLAINVSSAPMGVPPLSSSALTDPYTLAASLLNSTISIGIRN